jgi:hypothetical protein
LIPRSTVVASWVSITAQFTHGKRFRFVPIRSAR